VVEHKTGAVVVGDQRFEHFQCGLVPEHCGGILDSSCELVAVLHQVEVDPACEHGLGEGGG